MPATSNLEVMRMLSERIGGQLAQKAGESDSARILVQVLPREISWYVEGSLLRGISAGGLVPVASGHARFSAEVGISRLFVQYQSVRRDGFLGPKILDREVTVTTSVKVVDRASGAILWSDPLEEKYTDSVLLEELGTIENENLPVTRGRIPGEGFFSSVAEPLIALGAIAVAVLLLFHVRS